MRHLFIVRCVIVVLCWVRYPCTVLDLLSLCCARCFVVGLWWFALYSFCAICVIDLCIMLDALSLYYARCIIVMLCWLS
jgi:hypothetical protein